MFAPQVILETKVSPSPQPLSLPTALPLSREPTELPQTLTASSIQGGRPAALISSGQLWTRDPGGQAHYSKF